MITYATEADLTTWLGSGADVPNNAASLLRHASLLVGRAVRTARYRADTATGLPVDEHLVDALRDATCAQAQFWAAADIDPVTGAAGAMDGQVSSSSIGGATVQTATYASVVEARQAATGGLCDASRQLLAGAGLLSAVVASW